MVVVEFLGVPDPFTAMSVGTHDCLPVVGFVETVWPGGQVRPVF